jgi:hypothetical protein
MEAPNAPLTVNAWTMDIPGFSLKEPNFSKVAGPNLETGILMHSDGGTGHRYKFSDHNFNWGAITLVRVRDGSVNDSKLADAVRAAILYGKKYNGTFSKYHHSKKPIQTIVFTGLTFKKISKPDFDTEGSGKYEEVIECEVDFWEDGKPTIIKLSSTDS